MKAITVKQPWASLIVEGIKDIENRTAFFKWGITVGNMKWLPYMSFQF